MDAAAARGLGFCGGAADGGIYVMRVWLYGRRMDYQRWRLTDRVSLGFTPICWAEIVCMDRITPTGDKASPAHVVAESSCP